MLMNKSCPIVISLAKFNLNKDKYQAFLADHQADGRGPPVVRRPQVRTAGIGNVSDFNFLFARCQPIYAPGIARVSLNGNPRSCAFTRALPSPFDLGSGFAINAGKSSVTWVTLTAGYPPQWRFYSGFALG